jgi:hypothetical protein
MKLPLLKDICKKRDIKGYSKLNKEGLIKAILDKQNGTQGDIDKKTEKEDKPKKQIPEGFLKKLLKSLDKNKISDEKEASDEDIINIYKSDIESYINSYTDKDIYRFVDKFGVSSMLTFMKSGTKVKFSKITELEAYKILCLEYMLNIEDNKKKIVKAVKKTEKKSKVVIKQVDKSERIDVSEEEEEPAPIDFEETEE